MIRVAATAASPAPKETLSGGDPVGVHPEGECRAFVLCDAPESEPEGGVVDEKPEKEHENRAGSHDQDPLHVHIGARNHEALIDEDRQRVLDADEAQIPEEFQDGQADAEGGDHLGEHLAAHAQEHKAIHQSAQERGEDNRENCGNEVGQLQIVEQYPGHERGQDVEGPVGKIGHPADAEGEIEPDGHQGKHHAVDQRV